MDRDDFTDVYIASLCELSITLENQPEANTCDDAIQDLENRRN
jgi:hypothetical protein